MNLFQHNCDLQFKSQNNLLKIVKVQQIELLKNEK